MALPAPAEDEDAQRTPFRALRQLRDRLATPDCPLRVLSMGMSDDLEAAIAEGRPWCGRHGSLLGRGKNHNPRLILPVFSHPRSGPFRTRHDDTRDCLHRWRPYGHQPDRRPGWRRLAPDRSQVGRARRGHREQLRPLRGAGFPGQRDGPGRGRHAACSASNRRWPHAVCSSLAWPSPPRAPLFISMMAGIPEASIQPWLGGTLASCAPCPIPRP